jgi:hypothetical protein
MNNYITKIAEHLEAIGFKAESPICWRKELTANFTTFFYVDYAEKRFVCQSQADAGKGELKRRMFSDKIITFDKAIIITEKGIARYIEVMLMSSVRAIAEKLVQTNLDCNLNK